MQNTETITCTGFKHIRRKEWYSREEYDKKCEDYLEKINNLEAQLSRSEDKLHTCTMYNYDFQKENRDLKKENNELKNQIHGIELGIKFATQNRKIMNQNRIQRKRKLHK